MKCDENNIPSIGKNHPGAVKRVKESLAIKAIRRSSILIAAALSLQDAICGLLWKTRLIMDIVVNIEHFNVDDASGLIAG